ncbi:MAG TPA: hypothetical protein HA362_08080 [Nanoarchaeota archaeon]|nr:hypothetical protein [Nanoarchaeota archaeon]
MKLLKRGDAAAELSTFVILMALFVILYIVLLPPGDRDMLLNQTTSSSSSAGVAVPEGAKVLLSESPGMVYSYSKNIQTVKLEPIHLYEKDETTQFNLVKSLSVSRNILKDGYKNVIFTMDDMEKLSSAKLFMAVSESRGMLTIKLNGHDIYQGVLTSEQLPIDLPKEYLQASNTLALSVSLPPFSQFYKSNYYLLQDLKLIKTYSVENTEVSRAFFVDTEAGTVKKATLGYIVNCNALEPRGSLTIKVNSRLLSKDTIFCDFQEEIKLPIDTESLADDGRNRVSFSIDKGDYNLDQAAIKVETGKSTYPSYTFDISSDHYQSIKDGSKKLFLKFKLRESGRKKALVSVQDSEFSFDTSASEYSKDISAMVDDGANYVKIVPKEDFEIVNLKVMLQ